MAELSSLVFVRTDALGRPTGLVAAASGDVIASSIITPDIVDPTQVVINNSSVWEASPIPLSSYVWNNATTVVNQTSAIWNQTNADVAAASAGWNTHTGASAPGFEAWNQMLTDVGNTSAVWNQTNTDVAAASGSWDNVATSAVYWNNALDQLSGASSTWDQTNTDVANTSAVWNQTNTDVAAASGNWDATWTSSVYWNNALDDVATTSSNWNAAFTKITGASSLWEYTANRHVASETASFSTALSGDVYLVNTSAGNVTVTLTDTAPEATYDFPSWTIKKVSTDLNTITLDPEGDGATIDGQDTYVFHEPWTSVEITYDGRDYFII